MKTAQEIIQAAMSDREEYERMAAEEMRVWGKQLPEREADPATLKDRDAAAQLRVNRYGMTLAAYAQTLGLHFEHALSLGCGEGRAERDLIDNGICDRIHAIDVAADAVASGRAHAEKHGMPITYEVADVNFVELPECAYDLVVAQTSLHHLVFLENVISQVWKSLKPDGLFWVHDFIGETQFQYLDKRLAIINRLLSILPKRYRTNSYNQKVLDRIVRRAPGTLVSPFESIRSGDIRDILLQWFDVEWMCETQSLVHLLITPGFRAGYVDDEDSRAIFELILMIDDLCIKEGLLPPVTGIYALRPKPAEDVAGLLETLRKPFS